MQEDVEQRSVTLAVNGTKFTGRLLKSIISKYLAHRKEKQHEKARSGEVIHHGKQTVKQLVGQNQGVSNIEIADKSIRDFERIARKYGVDYAVKKVDGDKPKFLVFFKARDADALTAAFTEYAEKKVRRKERPSVIKLLKSILQLRGVRPFLSDKYDITKHPNYPALRRALSCLKAITKSNMTKSHQLLFCSTTHFSV